jgi:hypothetical protein
VGADVLEHRYGVTISSLCGCGRAGVRCSRSETPLQFAGFAAVARAQLIPFPVDAARSLTASRAAS